MTPISTRKAVSGSGERLLRLFDQTWQPNFKHLQEKRVYLHSTLLVCASCSAGSGCDARSACEQQAQLQSKQARQNCVKQGNGHHHQGFGWEM